METFTPTGEAPDGRRTRALFVETFRQHIRALEQQRERLHVPVSTLPFQRLPGMAFHFKPEIFLQREGETEFSIAGGESFVLRPGEACVMPRGVPHGEVARDGARRFENVVACFYNETVAIHVACALPGGRPVVDDIHFFTTSLYPELVAQLGRIGELARRAAGDPFREAAMRGLFLATLAQLAALVVDSEGTTFSTSDRIFRCQWLIRNNLHDPDLGVEALAEALRCSPSHLSRSFHEETGERLVEYVNRIRLRNAREALAAGNLSVKEVASACGFGRPSYFARVFRQATGVSPSEYREREIARACAVESDPKVVYHDREERDFGLRPEVMARSGASVGP